MDHYEYTELLKTLTIKMQNVTDVVRPQDINNRLSEIEALENSDGFWNDAAAAGVIQKEKTQLERRRQSRRRSNWVNTLLMIRSFLIYIFKMKNGKTILFYFLLFLNLLQLFLFFLEILFIY